jgi:hypothetical protein
MMSRIEAEGLSPVDLAALRLAIEVTRKESPARRQQIDDFLSTRPWFDVAKFCASCAQSSGLRATRGSRRRATSATSRPPSTTTGTNRAVAIARLHSCANGRSGAVFPDLIRSRFPPALAPSGGDDSLSGLGAVGLMIVQKSMRNSDLASNRK